MRKRTLQPVNVLLNSLFRDIGLADRMRLETLKRQWQKIFPGPVSIHTTPAELKESKLAISVDSPAWLQHLKYLNKEILEKIASHGIKSIQFRLGSIHFENERKIPEVKTSPDDFRELTNDDRADINRVISEIDDDELKDVIRQAMEKAASRKLKS
ncbi:MAG: DUF721 domain-containing protein [Dissulfurispiraceae bacterium]|jgi:hypothetical protein